MVLAVLRPKSHKSGIAANIQIRYISLRAMRDNSPQNVALLIIDNEGILWIF